MEILEQEGNTILARLNFSEILALSNALNESLEHLEEWEFETRMGVSCDQVRILLSTFNKVQSP
jgi:hypothetical protein